MTAERDALLATIASMGATIAQHAPNAAVRYTTPIDKRWYETCAAVLIGNLREAGWRPPWETGDDLAQAIAGFCQRSAEIESVLLSKVRGILSGYEPADPAAAAAEPPDPAKRVPSLDETIAKLRMMHGTIVRHYFYDEVSAEQQGYLTRAADWLGKATRLLQGVRAGQLREGGSR